MLTKILIANRGEIAIRIMDACKDLDLDYIAVYTETDKDSEHVRRNTVSGPEQNCWRIASYTDPNELFAVADHTGCTAIHPGYGLFSENYRFARRAATRERPITFIGPNWEVLRDLGNKMNTRRIANTLGIPTITGSNAPVYNEMEAEHVGVRLLETQRENGIDVPSILIKPAAGGGGMGIEKATDVKQIRKGYRRLQSYAKRQLGDGGIVMEQFLPDCNLLEVHLLCSAYGERLHFGTSNCTIQSSNHQKRIAAAPGFDKTCFKYDFDEKKLIDQIVDYSLKMAEYTNYDSAGSWEWLVSSSGHPYLLEVNTRIQVESDVCARTSYIDGMHPNLVREQIRLALGQRIGYDQSMVKFQGAAIALRIIAEDTNQDFLPWIGTITDFNYSNHSWAAVYSHVPGDRPYPTPSDYDPNLLLTVVWGDSMDDAKEKAVRFIKELVLRGKDSSDNSIVTNIDYLKDNLDRLLAF
ncbi:MAG: biotin carboxylase N-terminal domain-containing protein [Desulforhopalus sp.]